MGINGLYATFTKPSSSLNRNNFEHRNLSKINVEGPQNKKIDLTTLVRGGGGGDK